VQSRKLLDNSAYHTVYKTIKNRLAAKGERPDASEDPLKNTAGEVMTSRDILRVCQHLMNSNSTAADRDLSLNNWLLSTCGRSDDGRLVFQADFCPPKPIKSLGGHAHRPPCMHNLAHIFNCLYPQYANLHGICSSQCSSNVISLHMVCCIIYFCMIALYPISCHSGINSWSMQFLDTKSCDPDLCLSSCLKVLLLAGLCLLWSRVERRRRMVKRASLEESGMKIRTRTATQHWEGGSCGATL